MRYHRTPVMNPIYFDPYDKEDAQAEGLPYMVVRSTVTSRYRLKRYTCGHRSLFTWYITI